MVYAGADYNSYLALETPCILGLINLIEGDVLEKCRLLCCYGRACNGAVHNA